VTRLALSVMRLDGRDVAVMGRVCETSRARRGRSHGGV